jgi:hypothetical protein
MIFGRKKRMIDVRELQRRGVVRIPKQDIVVPTNREGFVEFGTNSQPKTPTKNSPSTSIIDFLGNSSAAAVPSLSRRTESERISELDNKIYKIEQRIELLERKLNVNQPDNSPVGIMGW